jgi:hypothetical protein
VTYIKEHFATIAKYISQWASMLLEQADINYSSPITYGTTIGSFADDTFGKITVGNGNSFTWAQSGLCVNDNPYWGSCYIAPKSGTYTKKAEYDFPDQNAEYTFTATDGTKWYLFYSNDPSESNGWYIYQELRDPIEAMYFNETAIREIIAAW